LKDIQKNKLFWLYLVVLLTGVVPVLATVNQPASSPRVSQSGTPIPLTKLNKDLVKEFTLAQQSELKALEHRNRFEIKELKSIQDGKLRAWEKKEKELRYAFFNDHPKGADRRAYVKDFLERRDAMRKGFAEERAQKMKELEARVLALKNEHSQKLEKFKTHISEGQIPDSKLWPQAGS
jgi:hypothetical protein